MNLSDLRDIAIPAPPGLWPPSTEVLVLLGFTALLLISLAYLAYQNHRANAYRRAGLALLGSASTGHEVSIILKRVALAVFPRPQVAPLYGDAWADFLNTHTSSPTDFTPLSQLPTNSPPSPEHLHLAKTWIQTHKARK